MRIARAEVMPGYTYEDICGKNVVNIIFTSHWLAQFGHTSSDLFGMSRTTCLRSIDSLIGREETKARRT